MYYGGKRPAPIRLGSPVEGRYADFVPEFEKQKRTAAQQAGISFEKAVLKKLTSIYGKVEPSPWLYYKTPKRSGICQPDALLWLADDHICIVEIKLSWMRPVRQKLMQFYGPVVAAIHKDVKLSYLQIYKNAKTGSHKKALSIYALDGMQPGKYKECQWLGI
jgi:hypothetical protein